MLSEEILFGNSPGDLLNAAAITVAVLALVYLIRAFLRLRLVGAAETPTKVDDLFLEVTNRTRVRFWIFPSLYFGLRALTLHPQVLRVMFVLAQLAVLMQVGLWVSSAVEFWMAEQKRIKLETDAAAATSIAALTFVAKLVIWSVVLLLALDNLGFDISALLAGLGVGGVAIALATQQILGDLFASLSIVLDKPFVIGDTILVGTEFGTVEYVGLKTTRIRSVNGEELIISNSDLLASRIRNFKRLKERRVLQTFGVIYQTPPDKLERIPGIVREIIDGIDKTRLDRAHFKAFGASSLDFEIAYWVESPEYLDLMDHQEKVNLELMRRFHAEGIEFAYPTQTLYVHNETSRT